MYIEVTPAYGREYTRKEDVKRDWKEGKDFRGILGYINKQDADNLGLKVVVYYDNRRKQVVV